MKKILYIVTWSLMLTSCHDFLDIVPKDKAYQKDLLTDRKGFEMALSGVYHDLIAKDLFGKELKYGFLECLVGTYSPITRNQHSYFTSYRHDYNHPTTRAYIDAIWLNLYKAINETNLILEEVENIKTDAYYNLVKGEALGLRAFCHFQLLKLFGPVIKEEGQEGLAIPYRDVVSYTATKFSSTKEVIAKLNKDLAEARILLEKDPIRTHSRTDDLNESTAQAKYNSLLDRRGIRLNYYAILGFQALVAQWEGDLEKASAYAEEVIQEVEKNKIIVMSYPNSLKDVYFLRTPMENVFSLIDQNFRTNALSVFSPMGVTTGLSNSPLLFADYAWLGSNLYNSSQHGSARDLRYQLGNWIQMESGASTKLYKIIKYHFSESYSITSAYAHAALYEIKIISLHQLYMLAAEHYASVDIKKACSYLDKVRSARGIENSNLVNQDLSAATVKSYVFDELRKEGLGEGFLFTEYKRLYQNIQRSRSSVKASLEVFKFPVPIDEQIYNPI